eukprot:3161064-Prymnesium_polylepis.1
MPSSSRRAAVRKRKNAGSAPSRGAGTSFRLTSIRAMPRLASAARRCASASSAADASAHRTHHGAWKSTSVSRAPPSTVGAYVRPTSVSTSAPAPLAAAPPSGAAARSAAAADAASSAVAASPDRASGASSPASTRATKADSSAVSMPPGAPPANG